MTLESIARLFSHMYHAKDTIYNMLDVLDHSAGFFLHDNRVMLRNLVLSIPDRDYAKFKDEIDFLKTTAGDYLEKCSYCYPQIRPSKKIMPEYDKSAKSFHIMHEGKRLYFPKCYSSELCAVIYKTLTETEGLLGNGILSKHPHSYFTDTFKVESGDIVVDLGAAEGLFTLGTIDQAKETYVLECDRKWIPALKRTLSPYREKVHIINKFITGLPAPNSVTLDELIDDSRYSDETFFVKMDIEGFEREIISSKCNFLTSHRIKLACCTYHRQHDAETILPLLESMGYKCSLSDGYVLLGGYNRKIDDNDVQYPYFRKALIRAQNF